jgi:hypothetical protein
MGRILPVRFVSAGTVLSLVSDSLGSSSSSTTVEQKDLPRQQHATQIGWKLILFFSVAQRKILEFTSKSNSTYLYFVQPRRENFGIYQQNQLDLTVFCTARSENFGT